MDDFNAPSSSMMGGGGPTVEVKSKFDAEFRRFSLDGSTYRTFDEFRALVARLHGVGDGGAGAADDFRISYVDPKDNDLLPINNTDNYQVSLGESGGSFAFTLPVLIGSMTSMSGSLISANRYENNVIYLHAWWCFYSIPVRGN